MFNQTLDHFTPGVTEHGGTATFNQRYCIYSKYWESGGPIFFYVGNESPVDEYVNSTGLMWELAPNMKALIVFAEHRYEGKSFPQMIGVPNCGAYCTSAQAIADYATLATSLKREMHAEESAVIAFGGSYGGMLAAWVRTKYPNVFDGAIAASAPIWGTPLTFPAMDGYAKYITNSASAVGGATDMCKDNLLAAWSLITDIGKTAAGRVALSTAFSTCKPLTTVYDVQGLLEYAQGPWFDMAEGDYPFPSTYITFSVGPG
jgi:lysosomal Pro-X carboxypeptidase